MLIKYTYCNLYFKKIHIEKLPLKRYKKVAIFNIPVDFLYIKKVSQIFK